MSHITGSDWIKDHNDSYRYNTVGRRLLNAVEREAEAMRALVGLLDRVYVGEKPTVDQWGKVLVPFNEMPQTARTDAAKRLLGQAMTGLPVELPPNARRGGSLSQP